jgi:hypothetical protein
MVVKCNVVLRPESLPRSKEKIVGDPSNQGCILHNISGRLIHSTSCHEYATYIIRVHVQSANMQETPYQMGKIQYTIYIEHPPSNSWWIHNTEFGD